MVRHHDKHFTCLFSYTLRIFKGSFTIPFSQKLRLTKIPRKKTFPVCGHLHSLPFQQDILVWPGHTTGKKKNREYPHHTFPLLKSPEIPSDFNYLIEG